MKHPSAIVEQDDNEYLLLEEGYNESTRAVAVLARPSNPLFPKAEDGRTYHFNESGEWHAVARWTREQLVVADERHAHHGELVRGLASDYVEGLPRPRPVAWALHDGEVFAGSLSPAVPMGVVVHCHDDEDHAQDRAAGRRVVPIDNVPLFFNQMVRLGYAGALWNEEMPVFFCVDDEDDLQFLKVSREPRDKVAVEILGLDSRWESYEGAEEVDFLDNTQACDERLVEMVGRRPVLEWPSGPLVSVGPSEGKPIVLDEEDEELPHGVLFTNTRWANTFREENDPTWTVFDVPDPAEFIKQTDFEGCVVHLNPGNHRAYTGTLWNNGEQTVLDSFSGFWRLTDDGFEPTAE